MNYLILACLIITFLAVGSMDLEDELKQQELYCEMVSGKFWGDYNGNFKEVCPSQPTDSPDKKEDPKNG